MGVLGDADIAADEPAGVGFDGGAGNVRGGEGEQDVAGEDVGGDRALQEQGWGGVGEGPGFAGGEGDGGGEAGVSGVLPVDVPVGGEVERQSEVNGAVVRGVGLADEGVGVARGGG